MLLSGCVSIQVDHTLKRSGRYDLALTFKTSPEYKMLLNNIKEGLVVDASVKDHFEFRDTDTSITYAFTDLEPSSDARLFEPAAEAASPATPGMVGEPPGLAFLDPANVRYTKTFAFPYYVYTYRLRVPAPATPPATTGPLEAGMYLRDEADLLDAPTKALLMARLDAIWANDSVEVIIATRPSLSTDNYWTAEQEILDSFPFRNPEEQYVLLLASRDEPRYCKATSNIYDASVSMTLSSLNYNFSSACPLDPAGAIIDYVEGLEALFLTEDLAAAPLADPMSQLLTVEYTVHTFGAITQTNGRELGDGQVRFDVNPLEVGDYMLTFREFFLANLLGDSLQPLLIALIVLLIGGNLLLLARRRRLRPAAPHADPQLVAYIQAARRAGKPNAEIRAILGQIGWAADSVEASFAAASPAARR